METPDSISDIDEQLYGETVTSTGLALDIVAAGMDWIDNAMIRSRFNMYHEFEETIRHIALAVSVSPDNLEFSLKAHGFQPLPPEPAVLTAIKTILASKELLWKHVESLPTT